MISLDQFLRLCQSDDPRLARRAAEKLMSEFVQLKAWGELVEFFEAVILETHTPDRARKVIAAWDPEFQVHLEIAIEASLMACLSNDSHAIYVELEASSRSLDFHICPKFDPSDNDWAARPVKVVPGPKIKFMFPRWLHSTIPFEKAIASGHPEALRLKAALEKHQTSVATVVSIGAYDEEGVADYFFARLLAALGRAWDRLRQPEVHLACAEHDHPIIHYP